MVALLTNQYKKGLAHQAFFLPSYYFWRAHSITLITGSDDDDVLTSFYYSLATPKRTVLCTCEPLYTPINFLSFPGQTPSLSGGNFFPPTFSTPRFYVHTLFQVIDLSAIY